MDVPVWAQIVLLASALVGAFGVLWQKLLRPGINAASTADEMLPLLRELTKVFRDNPKGFEVLDQIAREFHADSGSTLRDVVNRLEKAANDNRVAAEVLKVNVEAEKQLAAEDRREVARLAVLVGQVLARQKEEP